MPLQVYNTLTRRKELFNTAQPNIVRIYTCGLTVYAPMHIGHARTYCFWDFFRRYLEYLGYHVISVINYTDIDDRIMGKSDAGHGPVDIAERNIATFRRDCRLLRIREYAAYTRATDFITEQVEIAEQLIAKGNAYIVDGEVFYDVESFPGYGKLSGRKVEEQEVGASGRVDEDFARKRNPADFTLWKPSDESQPRWETGQADWPQGRPGWHLECSAMSTATLGTHFDVHGGAVDNMFPHHENEIAQSEPLCGSPWVRYWLHPEHLDLRGEKMSKSLGNVIGVPELLEKFSYDKVRWFYAMNHYRTKLPFTDELIDSAATGYEKVTKLLRILEAKLERAEDAELDIPARGEYMSQRPAEARVPRLRHQYTYGKFGTMSAKFIERFQTALDDDLNSPQATAAIFEYVSELYSAGIEAVGAGTRPAPAEGGPSAHPYEETASLLAAYRCLARHLYVLGIEFPNWRLYPQLAAECYPTDGGGDSAAPLKAVIDALLEQRQQARRDKDFAKSDAIRDMLAAAGVVIEDTALGPRWEVKA
jgi:cysteinyl-tRNA synthetase